MSLLDSESEHPIVTHRKATCVSNESPRISLSLSFFLQESQELRSLPHCFHAFYSRFLSVRTRQGTWQSNIGCHQDVYTCKFSRAFFQAATVLANACMALELLFCTCSWETFRTSDHHVAHIIPIYHLKNRPHKKFSIYKRYIGDQCIEPRKAMEPMLGTN